MTGTRALVAAACLTLLACQIGNERTGDLQQGAFHYVCVDDSDRLCQQGEASDFPDQVATGSRFALSAHALAFGTAEIDGEIVPASTRFVEPIEVAAPGAAGYAFHARTPGVVAMLATRQSDGAIGDFTHVVVADISELRVDCGADTLEVGVTVTCHVDPGLAGALEYAWASDPTQLHVEADPGTASAKIWAMREGTVTLRVTVGNASTEIELVAKRMQSAGSTANTHAATKIDAGADDDAG
jgi:hypothetical protein